MQKGFFSHHLPTEQTAPPYRNSNWLLCSFFFLYYFFFGFITKIRRYKRCSWKSFWEEKKIHIFYFFLFLFFPSSIFFSPLESIQAYYHSKIIIQVYNTCIFCTTKMKLSCSMFHSWKLILIWSINAPSPHSSVSILNSPQTPFVKCFSMVH